LSYKDILINSDQKAYLLTKINLIFTILIYGLEILVLFSTKNYILYLSVQFFLHILQRWVINRYITKRYPEIDFKCKNQLKDNTKKEIFINIKAMVYHKIGDCLINSTDNIIISSFININVVAVYSNYLLVVSYLMSFANMFYNGILASLGNLIVKENLEKKYDIFNKINFLGFTIFSFSSVILINIFNDFIKVYAGDNYMLDFLTVIIIVVNFYITGMRVPVANMKSAAGLFDIDKHTPLIQSAINIFFSILLAKYMGLRGVLIGTFLSSILPSIQRPYLVYKHVLNRSSKEYFKRYIIYVFVTVFISIVTIFINSLLGTSSRILLLIEKIIISMLIYLMIYLLMFYRKDEFKYFKTFIINSLKRRKANEE